MVCESYLVLELNLDSGVCHRVSNWQLLCRSQATFSSFQQNQRQFHMWDTSLIVALNPMIRPDFCISAAARKGKGTRSWEDGWIKASIGIWMMDHDCNCN